jgi:hypothetical protein
MNRILVWLAEIEPAETLPSHKGWLADSQREFFAIFGALSLVILLVLYWAIAIRKPHRRHHRHHHHRHHSHHWGMNPDAPLEEEDEAEEKRGHKRHRRRRHEHLPRNPTLAETGGLPPIRTEKPPGASPP